MDMNIEMDKNTATDSITSRLADARNDLGITQLSRPLTHQRLPPVPPDYPGLALPRLLVSTLDQKKFNFFVPSNITFYYTCYRCILKAILMPAEERSAIFSRHSKLHKHPSYLKNGSSVFHIISILSSPLIITFLITFWIFSLSKDSILMILSNCVSNLLEELSSGGISVLSCSIS